jgi:hypothetical protein
MAEKRRSIYRWRYWQVGLTLAEATLHERVDGSFPVSLDGEYE